MNEEQLSAAKMESAKTLEKIKKIINTKSNFLLEAGAGSGKTYTLIKTLEYIIASQGLSLQRNNQKIACITYTNAAVNEIERRIDKHPIVKSSTIHSFCWSAIQRFQKELRVILQTIDPWKKLIQESSITDISGISISYNDPAKRSISESKITLWHDDVISLMAKLLEYSKFQGILSARYPIILIDEYQDTNKDIVDAFQDTILCKSKGPIFGFFGDSWQQIYSKVCGPIHSECLETIQLKSNFRSTPTIVNALNRIRPDLSQEADSTSNDGEIIVYHTNNWGGQRQSGQHWRGDLPRDTTFTLVKEIESKLISSGWEFSPKKTKILMLTHRVLSDMQGYKLIFEHFDGHVNRLIKKEDPYIEFFTDVIEEACEAYQQAKYGKMREILKYKALSIQNIEDKIKWNDFMDQLDVFRNTKTIGEVLQFIDQERLINIPEPIRQVERRIRDSEDDLTLKEDKETNKRFMEIPYSQIINASKFIDEYTPFSTKHGVKGEEYENVLIIFGRGWSNYNWNSFLEWSMNGVEEGKENMYFNNRNLFYVSCSRAKKRLLLLFTQELTEISIRQLNEWFLSENVYPYPFI